jgi:hypothetical protein
VEIQSRPLPGNLRDDRACEEMLQSQIVPLSKPPTVGA